MGKQLTRNNYKLYTNTILCSGLVGTLLGEDGVLGDNGPLFSSHSTLGNEGPVFGGQDLTGKNGPIFGNDNSKRQGMLFTFMCDECMLMLPRS